MLRRSSAFLAERGSPSPRLDAELLLSYALGLERIELYTRHDRPLTRDETRAARELVARRGRREPVAHLVGTREFRGLALEAGPAALVPRPETELLVEQALRRAPQGGAVLDWGTGSGAVALALADEGPALRVTALERSVEALEVAQRNGVALGLAVEWVHSDGFAAVAGRRFDLIAANPPYLSEAELGAAPPELAFEPADALVAGATGLEALERLAAEAPGHLAADGWLLAEIGCGQADAAERLWRQAGLAEVAVHADLASLPRVVEGHG